MKILHICQFLGVGGLEKVLYLLINEQIKADNQVTLLVYDWEQSWVNKFKDSGIHIINSYNKKDGYDFGLIKYLDNIIDNSFDIVHTHDLNPAMYISPLKLLRRIKFKSFPKFVHTTHGMEHLDLQPKTRIYEKFISLFIDKLIAVSPKFKDFYITKTFISKKNIFNIDNGTPVQENVPTLIDKEQAKQRLIQKLKLDPNKPIFSYVARIVPLKGQDFLLNEFSKRSELQLLLIGPSGNNKYWDKCEKLKTTNSYMVGSQENINELLMGSDFYISSSHHEGIPISVLEAGALGLPCVLTNIPGHKTLDSEDKKIAAFFDVNNSDSLNNALIEIEMMKNDYSKNIHEKVLKKYSSKRMYNDYDKIYREK